MSINLFDTQGAMVSLEMEPEVADSLRLVRQDEILTVRGYIEKVDPLYISLNHGKIER